MRLSPFPPRIAWWESRDRAIPFATPEKTLETLRLVRKRHPEMLLCVASNGLGVAPYAAELAALGVSHVTLTVNAVDPVVGAKIYAWVRDKKRVCRGVTASMPLGSPGRGDRCPKSPRDHGEDQHDYHPRRERRARGRRRAKDGGAGSGYCELRAAVSGGRGRHLPRTVAAARRGGIDSCPSGPIPAHHGTLHPLPRRCRWTAGRVYAGGDRTAIVASGHDKQCPAGSALCCGGHLGGCSGQSASWRSGAGRRI